MHVCEVDSLIISLVVKKLLIKFDKNIPSAISLDNSTPER